ncbi:MAG: hypothetical protein AAGB93_25835, partial [Planctomycetota bacterium]
MIRALSLLVFAGLVAALLLLPGVSPTYLAAMRAGDLMAVEGEALTPDGMPRLDGNFEPVRAPFWQLLVESDAVGTEIGEDGKERRFLRLGGGDYRSTLEATDINSLDVVMKSVVRGLRAATGDGGSKVEIPPFKKTDPNGVNLAFRVEEDTAALTAAIGGTPFARVEAPRIEVSQLSLLPPLVAIFLAILFRRPVIALFAGVLVGSFLVRRASESAFALTDNALVDVFGVYLAGELRDRGRTEIILFVVFMLAMVGVITRA